MLLCLAANITGQFEKLNSSLQSKNKTVSGMKAAIGDVLKSLNVKRSDEEQFNTLYDQSVENVQRLT